MPVLPYPFHNIFYNNESGTIAGFMTAVLENKDNTEIKKKVREEVKELCERFPPPGVFVD